MAEAPILSWEGLGLQQGGGWLFGGPSQGGVNGAQSGSKKSGGGMDLHIGPRDRVALIGRNGAGKTTLLKLIAGEIEADRGIRTTRPNTNVVMLEQEPDFDVHTDLMSFAMHGSDAPASHDVESIAGQLGIDMTKPAASASGGERRRASLARALAQDPDLLLLDEPTNHLDLAAIEWLESWLKRFNGAFVTISHDRTFLKRLTKQTLWLDRGGIKRREIGFGGYEAWEEEVYAEEARNLQRMDAKLKIEARWLERGVTARRKRNQGRLTKLWEMRAQRAAVISPGGTAKMMLGSDGVKTKSVIVAEGVSKSFGEGDTRRTIIDNFDLRIQRGDRIGIVGSNGAGKTTLLKMLIGEMQPDEGTITLANTLSGVMIDQQRSLLSDQKSVRDILADGGDWVDVRGERKHVQSYLKDFMFDVSLIDAKVGTLSGGERSRLLFAREFSRLSNLLVLDEPTNDLDLETLDLLQEVIADYDGTVIIVSHDRDFLDRTVTVTLGLDGSGKVDIVAGGYEDWVKQRKADAMGAKKAAKSASKNAPKQVQKSAVPSAKPAKLSYRDQRDYEQLPTRIEELEDMIARGEQALADPKLYSADFPKFERISKAIEKAREEKDEAEMRWLELAEMVEG